MLGTAKLLPDKGACGKQQVLTYLLLCNGTPIPSNSIWFPAAWTSCSFHSMCTVCRAVLTSSDPCTRPLCQAACQAALHAFACMQLRQRGCIGPR